MPTQPTIHPFESVKQCPKCRCKRKLTETDNTPRDFDEPIYISNDPEKFSVNHCTNNHAKCSIIDSKPILYKEMQESEWLLVTCPNCDYKWFEHCADYQPVIPLTLEEMTEKGIKWPLDTLIIKMGLSTDLKELLSMATVTTLDRLLKYTFAQLRKDAKDWLPKLDVNKAEVEITKVIYQSGHLAE